jgi:hypothetical protein
MRFENLLFVNAVIAVPMGIAFILAPARLLTTYGVTLSPMGLVIYQFWGVFLVGLGLLVWSVRKVEDRGVQRAIALTLFLTYGASCIIAVRGQLAGANITGWSTVVFFSLLALTFGYYRLILLRRPDGRHGG